MNMLQVKNLSCGYGAKEVIKSMSFSVRKGDFLGIIGPNGAGKTTLFRAITGVLSLREGNVLYKGRDISGIPPRERAREIAVMPQILEVPFAFSVEEFVLMGRFPHVGRFGTLKQNDYRVLEKSLELTDTASLRKQRLLELSGGERQRAILAQGFAQEPRLLLLDEPTAHLDIAHKIRILDIVKNLNKEFGLTVIVILHDLNLASEYCKRLLLLDEGAIYKNGSPEEILTYKNIEKVYKTIVVVGKNPISSKPYILPVPEEERRKRND